MRILFLTHSFYPNIGGIETHSEIMADAFCKSGHEVRLVTWTKEAGSKTFPYVIIRNPGVRQLIRECLHSEAIFENNICLRLSWPALFFTRPVIVVLHTWLTRTNGRKGLQDIIKQVWLRRADMVISCSDSLRKRCFPKSVVINNPYNDQLFRRNNIPKTLDFVFLGRLVSDKGVDLAIKALHQLGKRYENEKSVKIKAGLTIIGDGPERNALQDLVEALELKNVVHFKGALSGNDLVECLNRHRFIIVPSTWDEPFGMVALEGMACGCIPIVSDGGGLPGAVGEGGVTFKRGDVNALMVCIENVLYDKELQLKLRNAADSHLENHRRDIVSMQYLKKIESALKQLKYT